MKKDIKYTGYTATPSDYECQDGELDVALNLVNEDGEMVAVEGVQARIELLNNEELIYIHIIDSGTKIYLVKQGTSLLWFKEGESERNLIRDFGTNAIKCTSNGNILCVYNVGKIEHFLYEKGGYHAYGEDFDVNILFGISREASFYPQAPQSIEKLLVTSNQSVVNTYNQIYNLHFTVPGTDNSNDNKAELQCSLVSGKKYRIHYIEDAQDDTAQPLFFLYNSGSGSYERINYESGNPYILNPGSYYEFTAGFNVSKIGIRAFLMAGSSGGYPINYDYSATLYVDEVISEEVPQPATNYVLSDNNDAQNGVYGYINTHITNTHNANKFIFPFFVRYGFRLKSDEIITVSPPILIEPNTGIVPEVVITEIGHLATDVIGHYWSASVYTKAFVGTLKYKIRDKEKIKALIDSGTIESLIIAISDPIYRYKQNPSQEEINARNAVYASEAQPNNKFYGIDGVVGFSGNDFGTIIPASKSDEYENLLISSIGEGFHIVKEIEKDEINLTDNFVDVPLDNGAISNLSANKNILPKNTSNLDLFDCDFCLSYNMREHAIGIKQSEFTGFDLDTMCGYVNGESHPTNYKFDYETDDSPNVFIVRGKKNENSNQNRRWLYFDTPNTKNAVIYENEKVYRIQLKDNANLTGKYYFGGLGDGVSQGYSDGIDAEKETVVLGRNNIMKVSEEGEPIKTAQTLQVGSGKLLAAASNTKPISRGQAGVAPLFVFATDGVWAIKVGDDGTYSVLQPLSRDVLINKDGVYNIDSITPIDNAVLYITDRGIMAATDADRGSFCLSDNIFSNDVFDMRKLDGLASVLDEDKSITLTSFRQFISEAKMLYDYTHQRIIVYNPEHNYAYVYSLKSKNWGMMKSNILYGVNSYPDCWAVGEVGGSNKVIDLSAMGQQSSGEAEITEGVLITRPLKLDEPDVLKTVDTIIQRGKFNKGHVQTILYGSRDLFNWHLVSSSVDHILRGFRGTPYKYFRIVLLTKLEKGESIYGCTIQYTPRLIDKIR